MVLSFHRIPQVHLAFAISGLNSNESALLNLEDCKLNIVICAHVPPKGRYIRLHHEYKSCCLMNNHVSKKTQLTGPYGIQTQMYDVRLTIAIEISYKLINALIHVSFTSYESPTLCTAMFVFSFCAFLELYHLSTITWYDGNY